MLAYARILFYIFRNAIKRGIGDFVPIATAPKSVAVKLCQFVELRYGGVYLRPHIYRVSPVWIYRALALALSYTIGTSR